MTGLKKVLIVEDSNIVRLEVKRALRHFDVELLELNNAEDIFLFPKRYQKIDLILLDITLPGMDGLTALEKINENREWPYIPVIMLTGRADRRTVQRALKAGAVNYIRKPFSIGELLDRIERVLGPLNLKQTRDNSSELSLEDYLKGEIKRAKRGKYPVSLVEIKIHEELQSFANLVKLQELQKNVTEQLREVDTVFITETRNLMLILPFTDLQGREVVAEKICKLLQKQGCQNSTCTKATFPEDGAEAEVLLNKL